jgi:hypothetical protein
MTVSHWLNWITHGSAAPYAAVWPPKRAVPKPRLTVECLENRVLLSTTVPEVTNPPLAVGQPGVPALLPTSPRSTGPLVPIASRIIATGITRNSDGSVDFTYAVENVPLARDTTVGLFWAQGATPLSNPVYAVTAARGELGTYGPYLVAANILGVRPAGATNLLEVADPGGTNSVYVLPPDIVVASASTTDSVTLTVQYQIANADLSTPFTIAVYRSPTAVFDPSKNELLATGPVPAGPDTTLGVHSEAIAFPAGNLWPGFDPFKYVLAVADPVPSLLGIGVESGPAYYRNFVIGAVSVGFDPSALGQNSVPQAWVNTMAQSLVQAGYDAAIPFGWASGLASPQAIVDAGNNLTSQVLQLIAGLPLAPNDVVDVHLIGHSRGAVVISEVMQQLVASTIPQLQHGYLKMTLLDPHPANRGVDPLVGMAYGENADFSSGLGTLLVEPSYNTFEDAVDDPPVEIPGRVNEVEEYWEQNLCTQCPGLEAIVNLWGVDPSFLTIDNPSFTVVQTQQLGPDVVDPLTGVPGIGHSEVHDYYQGIINQYLPPPPGGGAGAGGQKTRPVVPILPNLVYPSSRASEPPQGTPAPVLPLGQGREWLLMTPDAMGTPTLRHASSGTSWHGSHAQVWDVLDGVFADLAKARG